MRKRGRPKGYIMSDSSRFKISSKLRGRTLSAEHKRKIAIAMIGNKNRVNVNKRTLIDDLFDTYVKCYEDDDIGAWIHKHAEVILTTSGIMSEYQVSSKGFVEIHVDDISNLWVDDLTPELVLELLPLYIDKVGEV